MKRYDSKPLDCTQKLMELQAGYFKDIWQAKEKGETLVLTGTVSPVSTLLEGLGAYEMLDIPHYGGTVSGGNQEFAMKCMQATERRGYARDMCGINRVGVGSFFLNQGPFGAIPKPDFAFMVIWCEIGGRWLQVASEHFGIPLVLVDFPLFSPDEPWERHLGSLVDQMAEGIEKMERITGKEYDDQKLIEAIHNECDSTVLWAKTMELNRTIPAPISQTMMRGLRSPWFFQRARASTLEFYRMLYDEVQERVQNQIAALATERCRLIHEPLQTPSFFPEMLKFVERYGAVFIGSHCDLIEHGAYRNGEGEWQLAQTPKERGIKMDTREDALRALAEWYLSNRNYFNTRLVQRGNDVVKLIADWHADGVVFNINRGCPGRAWERLDAMFEVKKRGIPNLSFEENNFDFREFSLSEVTNSLESLMESLGLSLLDPQ